MLRPGYFLRAAVLAASLAGCATDAGVTEKQVTAADVPLVFDYGGLDPANGKYRQLSTPRGLVAHELLLTAPSSMALFGYYTITGDYYFPPGDLHADAEAAFKDRGLSWGEEGTVRTGFDAVDYQLFEAGRPRLHCIALRRSFRDHNEAAAGSASQAQVSGFYCREQPEVTAAEAPAIAAALRLR